MNLELIQELYVKAHTECCRGEAWEFEKAFAKIVAEHCAELCEASKSEYDAASNIRKEFE